MNSYQYCVRLCFILLCLCIPIHGWSQDTLRLTLDSCLRYAYEHSSEVEIARLGEERAEVTLHSARWRFFPTVNASAGEYWSKSNDQYTHDFSMVANASMTLFDGLSSWNNYKQSKLTLQQSIFQMQQSRRTVGEQVGNAFLTLLMNQEKLFYQQHLLDNCRQQKEEGRLRYEVGKILESEYRLLEANLRQTEKEILNLKLSIEECQWTLQVLLNLPEEVVLDIMPLELRPYDTVLPPFDTVMQVALASQPDLKIVQMEVEMAKCAVRIARAVYFPTLSLSVGTSYYAGNQGLVDALGHFVNQSGLNNNIGLNLSIPILNYSIASTQVRQSKINLRQAEVERGQKAREFQQSVKKMYVATQQSLNNYLASRQQEQAYRTNYDIYRIRFNEGKVGIVELLQQQDNYLGVLNDYLQSKYTFILNTKLLELIQSEP